jgi:hypothetical protein
LFDFFQRLQLLNAFQHAKRVLQILKLDDLVEGIVFCDYRVKDFTCKPEAEYFGMVRGSLFARSLFYSMQRLLGNEAGGPI